MSESDKTHRKAKALMAAVWEEGRAPKSDRALDELIAFIDEHYYPHRSTAAGIKAAARQWSRPQDYEGRNPYPRSGRFKRMPEEWVRLWEGLVGREPLDLCVRRLVEFGETTVPTVREIAPGKFEITHPVLEPWASEWLDELVADGLLLRRLRDAQAEASRVKAAQKAEARGDDPGAVVLDALAQFANRRARALEGELVDSFAVRAEGGAMAIGWDELIKAIGGGGCAAIDTLPEGELELAGTSADPSDLFGCAPPPEDADPWVFFWDADGKPETLVALSPRAVWNRYKRVRQNVG
jgi:hypothetical protein